LAIRDAVENQQSLYGLDKPLQRLVIDNNAGPWRGEWSELPEWRRIEYAKVFHASLAYIGLLITIGIGPMPFGGVIAKLAFNRSAHTHLTLSVYR
jgi:hypothetical protein